MSIRSANPALVIALLALFFSISGSAAAKWLAPKNSVTSKSIKRNAVSSTKVKNNSLTGSDIKESTLKQVPSARNADTVGGLSAGQLTTSDKFVTTNVLLAEGQDRSLIASGPFSVVGRCVTASPGVAVASQVSTTGAGGYASVTPGNATDADFSAPEVKSSSLGSFTAPARSTSAAYDLYDPASGIAIQGTLHAYVNYGGENCRFIAVATVERP